MAKVIKEPLYNYRIKKNSRNEDAKKNKIEIWEYIILKNENIFQQYFNETMIDFYLE